MQIQSPNKRVIYYLDKIESLNLRTHVLRNHASKYDMLYATKFSVMRRRFSTYFYSYQVTIDLKWVNHDFGVFATILKHVQHFPRFCQFCEKLFHRCVLLFLKLHFSPGLDRAFFL